MRRIYLLEVTQHNVKGYVGSASAKDLVRLATKAELQATQEAQRPIKPKRLEEISTFVADEGTLSTSIVIGTKDERIVVHPAQNKNIPSLYYFDFPVTDSEFKEYEGSFDIMDGQHRLFSFLPEYSKMPDDEVFDITFVMYVMPTMRERRIIFKNTNEKQEKVPSNLLMWFREQLDMLTDKEQIYHPVVSKLSTEACSPLKGRIIMGAERITGGFKAEQLIAILDKNDIQHIGGRKLNSEKMLKLLSQYLSGWESAVGSRLADRDPQFKAFSKISGFRFMMIMLPPMYEQAVSDREDFSQGYVTRKLQELFSSKGIEAQDIFDGSSDYSKNLGMNPFASETSTTKLARSWSHELKALASGSFDPLASL
jgi:DGQHR domain-containing protein